MHRVLVVDDDNGLRLTVAHALGEANYIVEQAQDGEEAVNKVRAGNYNLVLLDVNMPKMSGLEALKEIKAFDPSIIVIMLTAYANIRDAIEATKEGAYNYLEKPIKTENLVYLIDKALKAHNMVKAIQYSSPIVNLPQGTTFVGQNAEMKKIFAIIDKVSRVDTPVLIRGESGTGKELVANAIHYNSPRKDERFVAINCSAIPENLVESEFFGHEKGAFTDAKNSKQGLVEIANGGTLFLDEIGELSLTLQPKLLRFLENGEFRRIGGVVNLKSNVRVIGATNKNLMEESEKKNFRRDLLFRLNVITLTIPPLRERNGDILLLADYFLNKKSPVRSVKKLSEEAKEELLRYKFPGNVRELEHIIERAIIFSDSEFIYPKDLNIPKEEFDFSNFQKDDGTILTIEELEKIHIKKTLDHFKWNRENTARALDISLKTLIQKF